jgi:hypothetical protein
MNIDISLAVGLASFILSIVLYIFAAISERRNRHILDAIDSTIKEWQTRIMESTIELMESRPEIVGKRSHMLEIKSKTEFLQNLSERIKFIIENQKTNDAVIAQSGNLKILLDFFVEATKSNIPPDILSDMFKKPINQQTETKETKQDTENNND